MLNLAAPYNWPYLPRLLFAVSLIGLIRLGAVERSTVAAFGFALYLAAMLAMGSFTSPWLLVGWLALASGFALSYKSQGPRPLFWFLLGLIGLHALAIPGSLLWGAGNWELTAGVLIWMAPAVLLYVGATPRVFPFLVPVFLVHAGLIIWQGLTHWHGVSGVLVRDGLPTGLAHNSNLAAGFLTVGIIYMLTSPKLRWLTPPMFMALLFTGSRWGLVVAVVAVLAMAVTRRISWVPLLTTVGALLLAVFMLGTLTPGGYQVAGFDSVAGVIHGGDRGLASRMAVPHIPSFLPSGVAEHSGLHNVPLRIAVESGIAAAALWVGITLWGLLKWRNGAVWWILLTLVALSMLDYYTWMGHLGGFWWLSIGLLVKKERGYG